MRILLFSILVFAVCFVTTGLRTENPQYALRDSLLYELMKRNDQYQLTPILTAIEIRKDDTLNKALEEKILISLDFTSAKPYLIYTSAKVGNKNAVNEFNSILNAEIPRIDLTKSMHVINAVEGRINYKLDVLKKMSELGIKPSKEAIQAFKKDLKHFPKNALFIIEAASYLKQLGIEMTDEETSYFKDILNKNWEVLNTGSIRYLAKVGIQPDWEMLFKTISSNKKASLLEAFLKYADEASREKYIKACGDLSKGQGRLVNLKLLIGATINDKTSLERLKKTIGNFEHRRFSNLFYPIYNKLPDDFLVDVATVMVDRHDMIPESCVLELKKRGMTRELDILVKKLEKKSEEYFKKIPPDWERALVSGWFISKYDREAHLNWLWTKLQRYPDNVPIASSIVKRLTASSSGGNEAEKKWIRENPEKLAEAIDVVLKFYDLPAWRRNLKTLSWNQDASLIVDSRRAMDAIFFLPDDVYKEYFRNR